jgi:hypothetical protein
MDANTNINRIVSLTFDENPKIRKDAAHALATLDDPAAVFALMELSYDKDIGVKKLAQDLLEKKKSSSREVLSFAEMFSKGSADEQKRDTAITPENKERMLAPITNLFEKKLGKERATAVKNKMMPAIEKVYMKAVGMKTSNKPDDSEHGRKTMQEFLTSYLEAISGLSPEIQVQETEAQPGEHTLQPTIAEEIGELGKEKEVAIISGEMEEIEQNELVEEKQEETLKELPKSLFQRAYETMMLSGGDDDIMHREMNRILRDVKRDIKLAYNLARKRFKEINITHLAKLKNGMRNVNTESLTVKSASNFTYPKGREKKTATRIVVNDEEENEAIVYLFDDRGRGIQPGMKIKITRGYVKTFDFSSETAITISSKGNVYIIL